MQLYNKMSAKEWTKWIDTVEENHLTLSFYIYPKIDNFQQSQDDLTWNQMQVLERIYVTKEGINT